MIASIFIDMINRQYLIGVWGKIPLTVSPNKLFFSLEKLWKCNSNFGHKLTVKFYQEKAFSQLSGPPYGFRKSLYDTVLKQMTQKLSAMVEGTARFLWGFFDNMLWFTESMQSLELVILIFFGLKNPVPENTRNSALSRAKFILELLSNIDFVPPQYFHLPLYISYFH